MGTYSDHLLRNILIDFHSGRCRTSLEGSSERCAFRFDRALELAQQSLRTSFLCDEHESEHFYLHTQRVETVAKTLIMIGSLHHELMDMDLARDNFLKAQEVLEEATRLRRDEAVPQLVSLLAGLRLLGHPSCAPQA